MARKVRGFERVLDAPALFAVAYDEIGSSIYFALGIVAATALGLTPLVLLATGILFLIVSLSYAEGTAAIPETGGAATFTRRAYNDLVGFTTGWVLFLDYLIVIALSTLFLPHYLAASLSAPSLTKSPWDIMLAVLAIFLIVSVRLVRRTQIHTAALVLAGLDIAVQLLVVVLGLACVFSPGVLVNGFDFAAGQGWHDLFFALPLAMLAYTGLETVANLAEETREPGRVLPRSLFSSIGLVVIMTVLISIVALSAFPAEDGSTDLADDWMQAPIVGIVTAFDGHLPTMMVDILRVIVGLSGALILFAAATTAITGCTRLGRSMAEHGMLPREFGRLERRSLVSREALVATGAVAIVIVIVTGIFGKDDPAFLASAYSFGVLFAFTAAQLAVIRLRRKEPDLERPFRAKPEVMIRGVLVPLPALIGAPLTFAVWILALITHPRRPLRRPGLAARRARGLRARAAPSRGRRPRRHRSRRHASAGRDVQEAARADEARRHRRGDGRNGSRAREGAWRDGRGGLRRAGAAQVPARGGAARRRPGARRGIARGGARAGRGERRRGGHAHDLGPLDRPRDRRGGPRSRRRPDRARLVATVAPAVAVLLADRRPRAALRPVRGARGRVP